MTLSDQSETSGTLRLAVTDAEDLAVLSAHLQDALLPVADATFLAKSRRFALVVSRVHWPSVSAGRQERRQTGFHFERVERVQTSGFDPQTQATPLQLLAIAFRPGDAPGGDVVLTFAGGASIKLTVECLEAELRDLGPGWPVTDCPQHRLDAGSAAG